MEADPQDLHWLCGHVLLTSPWVRKRRVKSSFRPDSSGQTLVDRKDEEEESTWDWGQSEMSIPSGPHNGGA